MSKLTTLFFILLLAASTSIAQTGTSGITGSVRDPTGAAVPGANVTAMNDATGVSYTQTTTDAGVYAFPSCRSATIRSRSRNRASRSFRGLTASWKLGLRWPSRP